MPNQEELEALEYNPDLDNNHVHCEPTRTTVSDDKPEQVVEYTHDGREIPIKSQQYQSAQ